MVCGPVFETYNKQRIKEKEMASLEKGCNNWDERTANKPKIFLKESSFSSDTLWRVTNVVLYIITIHSPLSVVCHQIPFLLYDVQIFDNQPAKHPVPELFLARVLATDRFC